LRRISYRENVSFWRLGGFCFLGVVLARLRPQHLPLEAQQVAPLVRRVEQQQLALVARRARLKVVAGLIIISRAQPHEL
jgi:hypothetical protein